MHVVAGMVTAGFDTMGKLAADIIAETFQSAGVKHCYGVVGYPRSIEPVIATVLGWMSWKSGLTKCDGERRIIDEQRR